ncbi:MAG: ABC transporter ATP-binding protein [SAR324 cluster bacterium]|nr:ABC transporter ATP-binding protein [SAR324 cluster bacterium]
MSLLEIENLSVSLPTPKGMLELISNVSFSMEAGARLGIVGESGCGKSLTALAMMGLLPDKAAARGAIRLNGENLLELDEKMMRSIRGNRIAMIFQEPMSALNPVKTIGSQISEGLKIHLGLNKTDAENKTKKLLDSVGLPLNRFPLNLHPHQLSGGQRQRVLIAIAVACEPDILIADEPTTALDVTVQEIILELINEITENSGMGLIMISHDLGVIAQTTEKVLVMYAGNAVESGSTEDVFQHMAHPYTHGLFAAMPKSGTRNYEARQRLYSIPGQVPEAHARPKGCNFAGRCFKATAECAVEEPVLKPLNGKHKVSCFHPLTEGNPQ